MRASRSALPAWHSGRASIHATGYWMHCVIVALPNTELGKLMQINFEVSAAASFGYYLDANGFNSNSFIVYTAARKN